MKLTGEYYAAAVSLVAPNASELTPLMRQYQAPPKYLRPDDATPVGLHFYPVRIAL